MTAQHVNWEAGTYSAEKTPPKQFDPIPIEINGKAPINGAESHPKWTNQQLTVHRIRVPTLYFQGHILSYNNLGQTETLLPKACQDRRTSLNHVL